MMMNCLSTSVRYYTDSPDISMKTKKVANEVIKASFELKRKSELDKMRMDSIKR